MNPGSTKEWKNAYPRTLLSIVASVGGLAMFLLLASTVLVSQPIGSTVRRYFYGVDSLKKIDPEYSLRHPVPKPSHIVDPSVGTEKYNLTFPSSHGNEVISQHGTESAESGGDDSKGTVSEKSQSSQSQDKDETPDSGQVESENSKDKLPHSKEKQQKDSAESGGDDGNGTVSEKSRSSQSHDKDETPDSGQVESENSRDKFPPSKETQEKDSTESGGDDGKGTVSEKSRYSQSQDKDETPDSGQVGSGNSKDKFPPSKETQEKDSTESGGDDGKGTVSEKSRSSQSPDKDETPDSGQVESDNSKDKFPPSKETQEKDSAETGGDDGKGTVSRKSRSSQSQDKDVTPYSEQVESENSKDKFPPSKETQEKDSDGSSFSGDTENASVSSNNRPEFGGDAPVSSNNVPAESAEIVDSSAATTNSSQANAIDSDCDLYHGKWVYDSTGPLYSNNSCPVLTQMQNCQGNGRPDKDYENWRWKPSQCDLPRLDPKKFLELMRGKTLAFIGDSVARNQMESMLCILWQVEVPKNRGNKKMQRYYFRSTSTMIVRIWSSWLVRQTAEPFDYAPTGVTKLHLDAPDEGFMQYITDFDVIVLSSGHWFAKQSVYILNNEIVGGQLWWPDNKRQKKIDNIQAFGVSVETILTAMGTHPNYTGLTIVRSFSPDHYEGGAWNTGGSCTGKVKPALDGELVENGFTNIMHEKQVMGFNSAIKKKTNKSKMELMDITEAFSYRHDGHPGPYRSPDPNKITKRGPDGRPPPQDCLHWCMPGPVDTWNELVFEIIRREFHDRESHSS